MADGKSFAVDFESHEVMNSLYVGALHIGLTVVGGTLIVVGIALNIWRFLYRKKIEKRRIDEILRFRDDAIMEPRMNVKVAEIGLREQMHWKEYFTRDSKPFDYPPKENNQPSAR